jgi:hypothetical protein
VALGIRISQLVPLHPRKIYMQWDLLQPTERGTYLFKIERSGSASGPWEVLTASLQNGYNYIDDFQNQPGQPTDGKVHLASLQRQIYYRVTVTPPSGCANSAQTPPHGLYRADAGLHPLQRGLRRRLLYDERIVLHPRIAGVQLVLIKKRRWGERCPVCYDKTTRAVTREQCPTCYGTSFTGGYWNPVLSSGRVYPPQAVTVQTGVPAKIEANKHNIQLLDVPLMQDDDIIVEIPTDNRYIVERQAQTEIVRKPVHQLVTVSLMARTCVEYTIPVDPRTIPPLF